MKTLTHDALGLEIALPDPITLPLFRRYWQARAEHTAPPAEGGKANPADVYAELWHAALAIAEVTRHGQPLTLDSAPIAAIRWAGVAVGQEVAAAVAVPKSDAQAGGSGSAEGPPRAGDRPGGGPQ